MMHLDKDSLGMAHAQALARELIQICFPFVLCDHIPHSRAKAFLSEIN